MKKETNINENYFFGIGRRKTSTASVRIYAGDGISTVNDKNFKDFYPLKVDQEISTKPLRTVDMLKSVYFTAKTNGGGLKSSREAISLAIARALVKMNPELKSVLKAEGLMTRDPRMVERKHTGLVKARKRPQYSKR